MDSDLTALYHLVPIFAIVAAILVTVSWLMNRNEKGKNDERSNR